MTSCGLVPSRLMALVVGPDENRFDPERAVDWVQRQLPIQLAKNQVEAVKCALKNKVMILTGGPGTGKTTFISAILLLWYKQATTPPIKKSGTAS